MNLFQQSAFQIISSDGEQFFYELFTAIPGNTFYLNFDT